MDRPDVKIGIATTVKPHLCQSGGPSVTRPALQFCRMAHYADQFGASTILFVPDDLDWEKGRAVAWTPEKRDNAYGNWIKTRSRLPDVIYDNVYVHLSVCGFTAGMRRAARRKGIPVFNPPLFNKLQMSEWLSKSELRQYVPETFRLGDINHAMDSLHRWGLAYLKPIGGYGGDGVTRIEHLGSNHYRVSIDRHQSTVRRKRMVLPEQALRKLLYARKSTPHLFQRGLQLLTIEGRKVDFRVVVHRDVEGKWRAVGIVPKVASPDGVVTNIIAGGERKTLSQCVALARRQHKFVPVAELERCALRIARRISRARPVTGLVGFDLGVDEQGKVWLIEMNPKPARSLLSGDMRKKSAECSAGFAVFLARQKRHDTTYFTNHVL